jgi:hypothetical protein
MITNCQRNLNSVRNSDKLKNSAAPSSGDFFSLSTGAAEIFIFLVLRVLLQFLISRDVIMLYMGPTLLEMGQPSTYLRTQSTVSSIPRYNQCPKAW